MTGLVYQDSTHSADERAHDLLSRMTLDEKVAQLQGVWVTSLLVGDRFDEPRATAVLKDGIGQVTRIGASTGLDPHASASLMNQIQRVAIERTRLGIPVVVHEESLAGYCARGATVFPQAIGLGASWDPELVAGVAAVIREQLLAVGARQALAPVLDVARDPRWGRVEETYGEDPVLVGTLGAAYVRAMQTDDLRKGVVATGKHFLAHALSEGGRNHGPVQLGPRELREVYAEPFGAAIREAGLASIMNSYSSIDGLPCAGSGKILTDLLRGELGFTGTVVADYRAVIQLHRYHRTASDRAAAAKQALVAGLDVELPAGDCFGDPLRQAVKRGEIEPSLIDRAAYRVLTQKIALGVFENPYVDEGRAIAVFDRPAQRALARRAATESIVLLSNDGVLPLQADARVAVIGPAADDPRLLQGDYHYPAHQETIFEGGIERSDVNDEVVGGPLAANDDSPPSMLPAAGVALGASLHYTEHITPLAALSQMLGPEAVLYEPGCKVTGDDQSGFNAAADAARLADVAIVFVGGKSGLTPSATVGEGRDASDLRLTGVQEELVAVVAASGTPTVVVVISGRVHTLEGVLARAGALVQAWPLGEEGGNALADVLLGSEGPSGRLPVSLPRSVGQLPVYAGPRAGGTKAMFSGSYTDGPTNALFPFGHGLSYTEFTYSSMDVHAGSTSDELTVRVNVQNSGARSGTEVVQLYGSDRYASVARPTRQLIGFARVTAAPGESCRVTFQVHPSRLAFFNPEMRFVVEPGAFGLAVASSSTEIRHQCLIDLTGPVSTYQQREIVATRATIEHLPLGADGLVDQITGTRDGASDVAAASGSSTTDG